MEFQAWFQCISGCEGHHSLSEVIYACPQCGSLLEVAHDLESLRQKRPDEWKQLFDGRKHRNVWPYGSGVWGKKEWVCPAIKNENVVSMYEGESNLFWAERLGKKLGIPELWIKLCGNSHTGSFKDLGMTVLVSVVKDMIQKGKDIRAVACASTGDTSAALAAYAAAAGIPAIVFLPKDKVSHEQLIQPLSNGALVFSLETDFDGCMNVVREVTKKKSIYLANSMNSLRIEGQKTVSIEIAQQFDWTVPDVVVIPGGNLGNISAIGKGFLMMEDLGLINKRPRLVCAQSAKANPLYLSYQNGFNTFQPVKAKATLASAIQIGNPVSYQKAVKILKQFNGIVEQATEDELGDACAQADRTGMFTCPHTGVALAALIKLVCREEIKPTDKIVIISTAHGLKFSDFKINFHESRLPEVVPKFPNLPIPVAPDVDQVLKTIDKKLERYTEWIKKQ